MTGAPTLGRLAPVDWPEIETFGRVLSEFCKVHVTPDHVLTARTEAGGMELRWSEGAAAVRLSGVSEEALQNLRDTLGHLLDVASPGLAARLEWLAGGGMEGRLPPNFRLARLDAATRLSEHFLRLRLVAEDLGFMGRSGLHLRLLQPADPANPAWPRLSAAGRTVWPAPDLLHMPVYTIRAIDAAAGWLDVDVYLHGRGATCAWARAARPGDKLGITGPGGGWLPAARNLCLGGDETALPVIARILETAAPETTGRALISVADPADILPFDHPPGVAVDWLVRGQAPDLRQAFTGAARGAMAATATAVLFGGEKSDAQAIRPVLRASPGAAQASISVAAYWAIGESMRQA